jgi:hypothetical protein
VIALAVGGRVKLRVTVAVMAFGRAVSGALRRIFAGFVFALALDLAARNYNAVFQ